MARDGHANLELRFEFPVNSPFAMDTLQKTDYRVVLPDETIITEAVGCFERAIDEALQPTVRETYLLPTRRRESVREQLAATATTLAQQLRQNCVLFREVYESLPEEKEDSSLRRLVKTIESRVLTKEEYLRKLRAELASSAELAIATQAEHLTQQIEAFQRMVDQVDEFDEDSASDEELTKDENSKNWRVLEDQVQRRLSSLQTLIAELRFRAPALCCKAERLREVAQSFGGIAPSETELVIREDLKSLLPLNDGRENLPPKTQSDMPADKTASENADLSAASTRSRLAAALRAQSTSARIR
jgi:Asp-tRNA(Asn)/Glu-tRNA(Gln) amidotransferase C subunit